MTTCKPNALILSLILAVTALALSAPAAAQGTVVHTSGSHVTAWDPIYPASADPSWTSTICHAGGSIGLDAAWSNPHNAFAFGTTAHPWQGSDGFDAEWINAWSNLNSQGPGGHSWTRYQDTISGTGDFVLQLLADNCSWIYIDGQLAGYQDDAWSTSSLTYPVTLSGEHTLDFIIYDGGGLAGGEYRLETNTDTSFLDSDEDGLADVSEGLHGTDPYNADTDGDGVSDGDEVAQGSDPLDPADTGTPPPAPGDKDRGHGNDADRCDEDNPGKGGPPACADKFRGKKGR